MQAFDEAATRSLVTVAGEYPGVDRGIVCPSLKGEIFAKGRNVHKLRRLDSVVASTAEVPRPLHGLVSRDCTTDDCAVVVVWTRVRLI